MTDYWVSQGRKFCEFCKCSIADNKPSIKFHENGRKHKENLAKRLTEMQKKAMKERHDAVIFEKEMKKVEALAIKAYKKDVTLNADYTSQLIQQGIETLPDPQEVFPEPSKSKPFKRKPDKKPPPITKKWMEAFSEADERNYYWNTETGESVWEPPEEGYLSLAEQKKLKTKKPSKGPSKPWKKNKKHGKFNSKHKQKKIEEKANVELEETKIDIEPIPYVPPFGKWKKVEPPKEKKVDLQLPKQEWVEVVVPKLKEDVERSFKEKTSTPGIVSSSKGETGFKKRKIGADIKRNIRQRLDTE